MIQEYFKIGDLSNVSGASIDTIRFYEEKGLLSPKKRSESGYRYYDKSVVDTLEFIQKAKNLGFSLAEIKEFLRIKIQQGGKCSLVKTKIDQKVIYVEDKINDLIKIKKALIDISENCNSQKINTNCHFIEILNDKAGKNEKR